MTCFNADESNSTDLAERDSLNFRDRIVLYWSYALRSTVSGCDLRLFESMEEEKQLELVSADTGYFNDRESVLICVQLAEAQTSCVLFCVERCRTVCVQVCDR